MKVAPATVLAAVLSLFMLGGCASWLEQPLDPAVGETVASAEALQADMAGRLKTLENTISGLEFDPDLTPEETEALAEMRAVVVDLQTSMDTVEMWITTTKQAVVDSHTNEDAILSGAEALSAAFGIPFVTLGVGLWRSMRKSGKLSSESDGHRAESDKLKTAIRNLDANKNETTKIVNWEGLKLANADAGLNSFLREIRGNGAG